MPLCVTLLVIDDIILLCALPYIKTLRHHYIICSYMGYCITVFIAVVPQMIGAMLHLATDVTQYGPHA